MLHFGVSYSVQGTPLVKALATVVAMGPGLPADVERLEEEGFDSKVYLEGKAFHCARLTRSSLTEGIKDLQVQLIVPILKKDFTISWSAGTDAPPLICSTWRPTPHRHMIACV